MPYVDGFVAAVPNEKRETFREFAVAMSAVFKKHGATQVVDCWGHDVPAGEVTSFPMAVKCEANETVVFGWMIWPSKEVRDAGWETAMADPRMSNPGTGGGDMPFDGKRMVFGGFEVLQGL